MVAGDMELGKQPIGRVHEHKQAEGRTSQALDVAKGKQTVWEKRGARVGAEGPVETEVWAGGRPFGSTEVGVLPRMPQMGIEFHVLC